MNITIPNKILLEKLVFASKYCLTKINAVPSLQGGLLIFSRNKLEIITTNLNDFFHTQIEITNTEDLRAGVDIRKIVEFLSFLSPGDITLTIEKNTLTIQKDKTVGTFSLINSSDFPTLPEIKGEDQVIESSLLQKSLPYVLFSVSRDETRPALTGVHFLNKDGIQYVVSTDGFRLSLIKKQGIGIDKLTLNAGILQDVIATGQEIKMTMGNEEKMVSLKVGDETIYTRLIEEEFPPFERVIPDGFKTRLVMDHDELLRNVKLASIFARDFSSIIVLEIKKEGMTIKPKIKEEKGSVVFQEGEMEGEEQTIAFNYKFVLDYLNNVKSKKVIFEMNGNNAPGIWRTDEVKDYIHVIMPIRAD